MKSFSALWQPLTWFNKSNSENFCCLNHASENYFITPKPLLLLSTQIAKIHPINTQQGTLTFEGKDHCTLTATF